MIIKKRWFKLDKHNAYIHYEGWYLFGVVPLYIRMLTAASFASTLTELYGRIILYLEYDDGCQFIRFANGRWLWASEKMEHLPNTTLHPNDSPIKEWRNEEKRASQKEVKEKNVQK